MRNAKGEMNDELGMMNEEWWKGSALTRFYFMDPFIAIR